MQLSNLSSTVDWLYVFSVSVTVSVPPESRWHIANIYLNWRMWSSGGLVWCGQHMLPVLVVTSGLWDRTDTGRLVLPMAWPGPVHLTYTCFGWTGVRSCYDEGKRTAETLTMDYHRGANVEVRFTNHHPPKSFNCPFYSPSIRTVHTLWPTLDSLSHLQNKWMASQAWKWAGLGGLLCC